MLQKDTKTELLNQCKAFVNLRLKTIEDIISSNQKGLQSETKSSAGDKHETGRAMLQLEMEKAGMQLAGIRNMQEVLAKIDTTKKTKIAHLGSIIETNTGLYFLSISAGKLMIKDKSFYAVSVSSPIGKILLGKKEKEEFYFNGKKNTIILVE